MHRDWYILVWRDEQFVVYAGLPICFDTQPSRDVFLVWASEKRKINRQLPWKGRLVSVRLPMNAANIDLHTLKIHMLATTVDASKVFQRREQKQSLDRTLELGKWPWQAHSYWGARQLQKSHKMHTTQALRGAKWQYCQHTALTQNNAGEREANREPWRFTCLCRSFPPACYSPFYWLWSVSSESELLMHSLAMQWASGNGILLQRELSFKPKIQPRGA